MRHWMVTLLSAIALVLPSVLWAQTPASPVRVIFEAQSAQFDSSARAYERIWREDGARIVAAMERRASLRFVYPLYADTVIRALVLEGVSNSGYRELSPMTLRASYPLDTKRATLVHELGHRLMAGLFERDEPQHEPLFLWLYDAWIDLYGPEFAAAQAAIERQRGGPYPAAWDAVTALSAEERAARWQAALRERLPRRR